MMSMKRNSISIGSHPRGHRAGVLWILILVLAFGAFFILSRMAIKHTRRERRQALRVAQSDPKIALDRFFVERSVRHQPSSSRWRGLLQYMSREDGVWFERNFPRIAKFVATKRGEEVPSGKEELQRYEALQWLLGFGFGVVRPEVSRVHTDQYSGVAYIHDPGRLDTLREVFLIQEDGVWMIRRFLGRRDGSRLMDYLCEQKRDDGEPLSQDEEAYLADPVRYGAKKRAQWLTEAGLKSGE
jgi:hypothetical protein